MLWIVKQTLYVTLFGFWACLALMFLGTVFVLTVVGFPVGLALYALGFKVLTLQRPGAVVVVNRS